MLGQGIKNKKYLSISVLVGESFTKSDEVDCGVLSNGSKFFVYDYSNKVSFFTPINSIGGASMWLFPMCVMGDILEYYRDYDESEVWLDEIRKKWMAELYLVPMVLTLSFDQFLKIDKGDVPYLSLDWGSSVRLMDI